jgi:hypothetical protein
MYDCRLPFGACRSCRIFQAISDAIVRFIRAEKFALVSYIDDFLIVADTESECQHGLDHLVKLIDDLGLTVNWKKVAGPARIMTFLGIEINCVMRTLSLPNDKLLATKELVDSWIGKKRCSKLELQRLVGRLNWCARVVVGGLSFLRNLINLMTKLKK